MQFDGFLRGGSFLYQILKQTGADAGVPILRQKRNVSEQYRCLTAIDHDSSNRASMPENNSIVNARVAPFASKKLHPDEGLLLIVVPTQTFQLFETSAGVNL